VVQVYTHSNGRKLRIKEFGDAGNLGLTVEFEYLNLDKIEQ
jgi:hypothetical protein